MDRDMESRWRKQAKKAVAALLKTGDTAVEYFTRTDLTGEDAGPLVKVWAMPEPQKILRKQRNDGSWKGPLKKTPVYPENHSDLVATFKAFRELVEKYRFDKESEAVEKAAEFLLSFQTSIGDIRGFIGNQYATYYTGYVLSLLTKAGYAHDSRIEEGMQWLLSMRQYDGGWTVPILTYTYDRETGYLLTSSYMEPVEPDRSKPFSHNWTDMVLRAFSVHPVYRKSAEARAAGELMKSRFFQPDVYVSYKAASYWTRFVHWWPNLLTSMESLLLLGFPKDDPDIILALGWFLDNQQPDGLWKLSYDGKSDNPKAEQSIERAWLTLRISRMLNGFLGIRHKDF
ncbi:MAG: terpene cyclase/mutase family protein [Dehalococcoidales bacterium]|nr:terpene cyclase/mutase family protein [Dehalococcoidales bacterium]